MLTAEENAFLTRVGPGTPAGELLRRYWQPACYAGELSEAFPVKRVKIMHELLVIFRDKQGRYGCLGEHCSHRGTSLYYGYVEEDGLRCCYHGWKYDAQGNCLEQPFEPNSQYKDRVKHKSYPVGKLAGILFVYMGPEPAPLLPRWDVLAWRDGQLKLQRQETLECNWLQAMENSADITHTYFLHGHRLHLQGVRDRAVNYFYRPYEKYGFQPFEWGILKSWVRSSGLSPLGPERGGGTPLIFPNMLRVLEHPLHCMHWRVPIDDTHTEIFVAEFLRNKDGREEDRSQDPPIEHMAPQRRPDGEYALDSFFSQDKMAWETGGPINDRSQEHLGATDRGIILYRQMLREQIEIVGRGGEPMALVRDPEKNKIIEVPEWITEMDPGVVKSLGGASALSMERVFDERHEVFEVPFGTARPRDSKTR